MVLGPTISPWPCFIYPPLLTILICGYVHHRHCGIAMDCRGNIISGGTLNLLFLKPFYSTGHHLSVLLYIYILSKAKSQYCVWRQCHSPDPPQLCSCSAFSLKCSADHPNPDSPTLTPWPHLWL